MGDRIVVMNQGEVRQIGTPRRGLRRPGRHLRRHVSRLSADESRRDATDAIVGFRPGALPAPAGVAPPRRAGACPLLVPARPRGVPRLRAHPLRPAGGRPRSTETKAVVADARRRHARPVRAGHRLRASRWPSANLKFFDRETGTRSARRASRHERSRPPALARARRCCFRRSSTSSRLVGVPFVLAFFYAVGDVKVGLGRLPLRRPRELPLGAREPGVPARAAQLVRLHDRSQILVLVGGNVLALALKDAFRGRRLVRFLILLPWVAPVSIGSIGWKWILDSLYSVINWVLDPAPSRQAASTRPCGSGEPTLAMISVILVHTWHILPFATVILLAGWTAIPKDIPEAAAVDGAGYFRHPLPDHAPDAPADHQRRPALRDRLHVHRHDRRSTS